MVWTVSSPPQIDRLPIGYILKPARSDDKEAYEELFNLAWPDKGVFEENFNCALDDGLFVIEHQISGLLVSSCAAFKPGVWKDHPETGSLGWLVTDPAHGGRGLATTVVMAVMNRLAVEDYPESYLGTEDERLAAIHIYLKLGWQPLLYTEGMSERWEAIMSALAQSRGSRRPDPQS